MTTKVWLGILLAVTSALADGGTVQTEDGLELTLDDAGRATYLQLNGTELLAGPAPLLSVTIRQHAQRSANLLPGGKIEDGDSDGTIDGWSVVKSTPRLNLSATPKSCSDLPGQNALLLEVNLPAVGIHVDGAASTPFGVVAGQTYRVSAWAVSTRGYLGSSSGNWQSAMYERYQENEPINGIRVRWVDQYGHQTGELVNVAPIGVNARGCKRIGGMVTAPAEAVQARVELWGKLDRQYTTDGVTEALIYDDVIFAPVLDVLSDGAGNLEQFGNTLQGTLDFPGTNLEAEIAILGMPDRLRIEGTLEETIGTELAVELSIGLPLDPTGLTFAADPRNNAALDTDSIQELISSAAAGSAMPISLYPMVAVDHPGAGTLALHLPREFVQFARLRWNGETDRYEALFSLGLSPDSRHSSQARFRIDLLSAPAGLGWRGAWEKTFQTYGPDHPTWFHSVHNDAGRYVHYNQGRFEYTPAQAVDDDNNETYSAQYILLNFVLHDMSDPNDEPPDYEQIMGLIQDRKSSEPELKYREYYSTEVDTLGRDDNYCDDLDSPDVVLRSVDNPHDSYRAVLLADFNPDLANGLARWYRDWVIEPALDLTSGQSACLDGIEIDNFIFSNVDYRTDHIALANHPLTFTESALRPGVHVAAGVWDFLEWLRGLVDQFDDGCDPRGISGNWWAPATVPLVSPFLDFFLGEGDMLDSADPTDHVGIWRDDMALYRRAISYRKFFGMKCTRDFPLADEELFRGAMEKSLLYAIRVAQGKLASWDTDFIDDLAGTYRTQGNDLFDAGWEPVSYSSTDIADIHLERYGNSANDDLHLVYFNRSGSTASFTLTIDKYPLGIASVVAVFDHAQSQVMAVADLGDRLEIADTLSADRGRNLLLTVVLDDADSDGVADADDCDSGNASAWGDPGRVHDLVLSGTGPTILGWEDQRSSTGGGTIYEVAAGSLSSLRATGDFTAALCAATGLTAATWNDDDPDPAPGEGRYYLVRSGNACGTGAWGYSSLWEQRTIPACP